ncbi:MAG: hypothetical protein PHV20_07235 [Bacteroidales bacterium]|nr:hypothetical protein [Bacteroidales bacterium]
MNFNNLQSEWQNENTENVSIPTTLEKIHSANMPLEKIKKNLKKEFIYQILSIIFIGVFPLLYKLPKTAYAPYYLLFTMFLAVCIYYLVKLYIFFKRLNNYTLNTKDSLYETYFDIRLNMEMYKTFGFALIPFLILYLLGILYNKNPDFVSTNLTNNSLLLAVFGIVAFSFLYMGFAVEWWVNHYYGKYAKEIRNVIDQLKED